ncbi:MAG: DUF4340 domain-containing protein [Gammaproteobacteria bacterium]|nr:DUF4340 domain-containing protein [Gammaproteobacteria bacterium]
MSSRAIINLLLLVLVAVLAALVYFRPGSTQQQPGQAAPLLAQPPATPSTVTLQQPGKPEVVLQRRGGYWWVVRPVDSRANPFRVDAILRLLQAQAHSRFPAVAGDLARYQLAPPLAWLRVDDVTVQFGGTETLNNYRYVQVGGEVALIDDAFYQVFTDVPALLALELLPPDQKPLAVTLPGLKLVRQASGGWQASGRTLSADQINDVITAWRQAQGVQVTAYGSDELRKPAGRVAVQLEGGQILQFVMIEDGGELVLVRPDLGVGYHLSDVQREQMFALKPRDYAAEPLVPPSGSRPVQ